MVTAGPQRKGFINDIINLHLNFGIEEKIKCKNVSKKVFGPKFMIKN
jgi:hypothetical protein